MKVTFIGANHEVTGSKTLLQWGDHCCLVDYGMEQGENHYESIPLPVPAAQVECLLVTHAHIDHTGLIPLLYKEGFHGRIFATPETCNLMQIMLADSAHIQETDAAYKNRKAKRAGKPEVEPLYTLADAQGALQLLRPCPYGERVPVAEGMDVRFTDVGHLLGSAAIEVFLTEGDVSKTMVFSGDVGNYNRPILNDPQPVREADYLMMESTYGDRNHDKSMSPLPMMVDVIQRTLDRGGNVVIPAFAVGRTQEMLYIIREIKQRGLIHGHEGFPVYVDSPLANEATAIFLQCDMSCLDEETQQVMKEGENPIAFEGLMVSVSTEESMALNENKQPKVILSTSGMCDAGRIRHHLKYNLWRKESTILFTGYQSPGTLGRQLQDGATTVRLFGDEIAVHAEIATLQGVSGHADKKGLLRWLDGFETVPPRIFINHGEHDQSLALA